MLRRGRLIVCVGVLLGLAATVSYAQFRGGRGFGFRRVPPRFPTAQSFDGAYNFCRGMFQSVRREQGGQGWSTDYPDADVNFSIRLSELTMAPVSRLPGGDPNHLVVQISDPTFFQCPLVEMEDVGTAEFSDIEVARLREYLLKGGFLWVDDFWGPEAWDDWERQIGRILPPSEYPIFDVPLDHPIFKGLFTVTKIPQIPSIQSWRVSGGETSERGSDSAVVHTRGIADKDGRVMVLMTHNTDFGDSWEREAEDPSFFQKFAADGYAFGINVLVYAMTH